MSPNVEVARASSIERLRQIRRRNREARWETGDELIILMDGPMDLSHHIYESHLAKRDPKAWQKLRNIAYEVGDDDSDVPEYERAWEMASTWPQLARNLELPWRVYEMLATEPGPDRNRLLTEFLQHCRAESVKPTYPVFLTWYNPVRQKQEDAKAQELGQSPRTLPPLHRLPTVRIAKDASESQVVAGVLNWGVGEERLMRLIQTLLRVIDGDKFQRIEPDSAAG